MVTPERKNEQAKLGRISAGRQAYALQLAVPTHTQSDLRSNKLIYNNVGAGLLIPGAAVTIAWDMRGSVKGADGIVFVQLNSERAGFGVSKAELCTDGPIFAKHDWQRFVWSTTLAPDVGGSVTLHLSSHCPPVAGRGVGSYCDSMP
ncbi:hypothetical protein EYC98_14355 [Halieaceae bacterium IMCC14734]|uniref:Uncharacterized protein n=1 Tax=Candidatus Litorirhabdus singularis TaxID=2518993 RepID=A0ABT3TIA0_9GAMM|nr:hypothetical protein [Candidatus Litorirhabdus singularis]MCX2982042.1 hypothetical protein [Candidatus Litorirhabdus singularis]